MSLLATDHLAYKLPVSVKGIIQYENKYLLRKNERNEWELLGGKLEPQEKPIDCLIREIKEEAGININIYRLIDAWIYCPDNKTDVLILTYGCIVKKLTLPIQSPENAELAWFTAKEIENLKMPEGYKKSIKMYENQ